MNTQTPPTRKLMLTVLGGVAQFEREMMLERQNEGVAKAVGKYKERKPLANDLRQEVACLAAEGIEKVNIARQPIVTFIFT